MTFEEFLRGEKLGLTPEQVQAITAGMAEQKLYVTDLENASQRYDKLKQQKEATDAELATANKTIADLKKASTDSEQLQATIKQHEETIKNLRAEAVQTAHKHALETALTEAGVLDAEYMMYKLGGVDKITYGDDGKPVGLTDLLKPYREDAKTSHLFKTERPGSGYQPAGGGTPGKNPFAKETYNLTEQGRLFKENPEQARALAAAAGVKL